jgi:D-sedoheptulose 7-phosphate isomerase
MRVEAKPFMNWPSILDEHHRVTDYVGTTLRPAVEQAVSMIVESLAGGGKLLSCGNGGSAADAQHLAAEFVNRFLLNRRPYAALALTTDSSILSSVGNDFGFDQVFEKQVQALGRPGDILVVFSTSGNSPNVVRAVEAARAAGIRSIGFLGGTGGKLQKLVDLPLTIACSTHTPRIQEGHLLMMHLICEDAEAKLAARFP